jgi:L-lactate dehydrogenase (cytochrome)
VVFDYVDGGADGEITLRENCAAYDLIGFRPRCSASARVCDLRTSIAGTSISMPVILAPVGNSHLLFPRGEELAAAAAGDSGTIYTLSTFSGCALEAVKRATSGLVWYQLYACGGREVACAAIDRAQAAGYAALVVTVDTPVAGLRERDVRNGSADLLSGRPAQVLRHTGQFLGRPGWLASFVLNRPSLVYPNVMLPTGPMMLADIPRTLQNAAISWRDFQWLRARWRGRLIVKGIQTGFDARRAVEAGADGIVVSNHGGRQLDSVWPTIRVLPEIVASVDRQVEVLVDGGIRRGADVVKALCLGARAVLVGRAYAYGLAAAGKDGVARALEILRADMVRTLTLLGCPSLDQLDPSYVAIPHQWQADRSVPPRQPPCVDRSSVFGGNWG